MPEPDLTILMPSYNKDAYIAQALDSVLAQKTGYSYRILVADDCSTDKTVEIVRLYQKQHPNKIELLTSATNQMLFKNIVRAYDQTKSKYFCVLDADDYWIDSGKIQKALDYLESHPDMVIYLTDILMRFPDGREKRYIGHEAPVDSTLDDYLRGKAVLSCTPCTFFRNYFLETDYLERLLQESDPMRQNSFRADAFRNLMALSLPGARAHYEPECTAVYRVTNRGLWTSQSKAEQVINNSLFFMCSWSFFGSQHHGFLFFGYKLYLEARSQWHQTCTRMQEQKRSQCLQHLHLLEQFYDSHKPQIDLAAQQFYAGWNPKQKLRHLKYKLQEWKSRHISLDK